jgi:hypothetical protein
MRNLPRTSSPLGRLRTLAPGSAALGLAVLLAAAPAHADDLTGSYEVKFEQVTSNCEHPLAYPQHGTLKIETKGSDVQVNIERTPLMVGKATKTNKISAKSPKPGHTPVDGMDGVFSIAGRVSTEGMVSLVMVGEYTHNGAPLCTQSWNLSGLRKAGGDAKPKR